MRFYLPLCALAAIALPASAVAKDNITTVPVRVSLENVDLANAADRAVLEQRIEAKLRKACTVETTARYALGRTIVDEKCVADARAAAMQAVSKFAANEARGSGQASAN